MTDEAAWKPDPSGAHELRYFDGTNWTEHVSDAGVQSTDPMASAAPAPPTAVAPPPIAPPAGAWAAPAPTAVVKPTVNNPTAGWILLAGAAIAAIGSCLPWANVEYNVPGVEDDTLYGLGRDGAITIVLAVVVGVLAFPLVTGALRRWRVITALVLAAILTLIAVIDVADVSRFADDGLEDLVDVGVGIGLWLTLIGGIAALVGGVMALVKRVEAAA